MNEISMMHLFEDSGCMFVQKSQSGGIVMIIQRSGLYLHFDMTANDAKRISQMLANVTTETEES